MAISRSNAAGRRPNWDGSRVLFEVIHGGEPIACAISLAALQEVGGKRCYKPADLLACFKTAYPRIEAAAFKKLKASPGGFAGRLNIWEDDFAGPEPDGVPAPPAVENVRRQTA
jgi:hypothetical protein